MNTVELTVAAVLEIARREKATGRPVPSKGIVKDLAANPRHFETSLRNLVQHGILNGIRGPHGGYTLAVPAGELKIGTIHDALKGQSHRRITPFHSASVSAIRVLDAYAEAYAVFLDALDGITIADLMEPRTAHQKQKAA